nr:hypothetical protein [uncultured Cohaesibacter sp.]
MAPNASKKNAPFRKKVKDSLNGIGGFSATICGFMVIGTASALYDGAPVAENALPIILISGCAAGVAFWLASKIKPRTFTTVGGFRVDEKEW